MLVFLGTTTIALLKNTIGKIKNGKEIVFVANTTTIALLKNTIGKIKNGKEVFVANIIRNCS
jgi:hypothetical protein